MAFRARVGNWLGQQQSHGRPFRHLAKSVTGAKEYTRALRGNTAGGQEEMRLEGRPT